MKFHWPRMLAIGLLWFVGLGVISVLDQPLILWASGFRFSGRVHDYWTLLKCCGSFPLWSVVGATYLVLDCKAAGRITHAATERGLALITAPLIAGVVAEMLKLLIRRERPDLDVLAYTFRPYSERLLYGGGLGMPSSHVAVGFAGFVVLMRLAPQLTPLWWALALLAAAQRWIEIAHYPSDIFVGATVGTLAVRFVWWMHLRHGTGALLLDTSLLRSSSSNSNSSRHSRQPTAAAT